MRKIAYPALFKSTEEGIDVTFPDIFGGVTCGEDRDDALLMAKDLLRLMLKEAPAQCEIPKSVEETKKLFPDDEVVLIEVEL